MNRDGTETIHYLAAPDHHLAGAVCSPRSRARVLKLGEYQVTRELPLVTCGMCVLTIRRALARIKKRNSRG